MSTTTRTRPHTRRRTRASAAACLAAGLASAAAFAIQGIGERGGTGEDVTARLGENAGAYQGASILAIYASLGLCLAAQRLGRRIGDDAGSLAAAGGVAVAFLMAAYFSVYAAGASVAEYVLDEAGPGVGEGTLVSLNLVDLARYAPSALLLGAVLAAWNRLPRAVTVPAMVLMVALVLPMTAWLAALAIPVWLGVTAACVDPSEHAS